MNKAFRYILTILLTCAMIISSSPSIAAIESNDIDEYTISFSNDAIIEQLTTFPNGSPVYITRTIYPDNTCDVVINESGGITSFTYVADYEVLAQILVDSQDSAVAVPYDRLSGYTYTPMKTEVFTDYYTPENARYATILSGVSLILSCYNCRLSDIAAIASMIFSASSAPVETKIVTTMNWYIVTVGGEFVSYYCEYTIKTYTKADSGAWLYIGTETGSMESLTIW